MKINSKIFSLPPHISTNWASVAALHMKGDSLFVTMIDGEAIEISGLAKDVLETIFNAHAKYLEEEERHQGVPNTSVGVFPFQQSQIGPGDKELPFHFGIGAMDAWGSALQHNPAQANMPNLPEEVLEKLRSISKIIAPDDPMAAPKPEPHCNCMYCQIARAINQGLGVPDIFKRDEDFSDEISDEELLFQQWEIQQADDKLYTVVNRRDAKEKYSVYLGRPVGCTCGKEGCEHILAVLKS